jgi:hypothetical protein
MRLFASLAPICAAAAIGATAAADVYDLRQWIDAHGMGGMGANSPSQLWYATTGLFGPAMTATGGVWKTPSEPYGWPMFGPLVNPGEYGGTAGPATFAGLWGRPGPNFQAVMVFAPQTPMEVEGMTVYSELIANGMMGDGLTLTVYARIGGITQDLGTVVLAHTTEMRVDSFSLGSIRVMNPGDTLHLVIGNNGSFLYDHMNFNAVVHAPGPGGLAALAGAVLLRGGRRRRA